MKGYLSASSKSVTNRLIFFAGSCIRAFDGTFMIRTPIRRGIIRFITANPLNKAIVSKKIVSNKQVDKKSVKVKIISNINSK